MIFVLNIKFNLIIIFVFFVKYLGSWGDTIKKWIEVKEGMFAFGFVGLMTLLLQDFMQSKMYLDNVNILRKKQKLRSRFVGLSEAYRVNESKIYNRVILISKMNRLAEIEEMFWNQTDDQFAKRPEEIIKRKESSNVYNSAAGGFTSENKDSNLKKSEENAP